MSTEIGHVVNKDDADQSPRASDSEDGAESATSVWMDEFFGQEPNSSSDVRDTRKRQREEEEEERPSPVESSSVPKRRRKPTASVVSAVGSSATAASVQSHAMASSAVEPCGMQSTDVSGAFRSAGSIIMPPQMVEQYYAVANRRAMNGFEPPNRTMINAGSPSLAGAKGRCKLCFYALSGALSVNKGDSSGKQIGVETQACAGSASSSGGSDGGEASDKPNGWEYHNGVAILSAIWKMYKSAELFASNDELCAAIARQWNAYISPTLKEKYGVDDERRAHTRSSSRLSSKRRKSSSRADRSSSSTVTHLGEMLIEKIRDRAEELRRDSSLDTRRRDAERNSLFGESCEEDSSMSSPPMSGDDDDDIYSDYDSGVEDEQNLQESDSTAQQLMMLTLDDVLWHFDNCSKTAADGLESDVDMLDKISKHLIENEMFIVAEDAVLDDEDEVVQAVVDAEAMPVNSRVIINDRALHMYLSVLNTKRQHADSMLRQKKEDGVPSAYTLLAMRREIDGDSKDNGIGVRNMQKLSAKGKLTGV